MPRLFIGIEIPDDVGGRLQSLKTGLKKARWIEPDNYHITLRFIGDIDDAIATDISDLLDRVRKRQFSLTLDGLGVFGGKKPRAVWARVVPNPALSALQMDLEQVCQRAGLKPETRKYTPHITVARLRGSSSVEVADYLSVNGNFYYAAMPVSQFALYSAKPSTGGGPYIVERTFPLSEPLGSAKMVEEPDTTGVEHL